MLIIHLATAPSRKGRELTWRDDSKAIKHSNTIKRPVDWQSRSLISWHILKPTNKGNFEHNESTWNDLHYTSLHGNKTYHTGWLISFKGLFVFGLEKVATHESSALPTWPLSIEYGTYKTVKAIFWPWLSDTSLQNSVGTRCSRKLANRTSGS